MNVGLENGGKFRSIAASHDSLIYGIHVWTTLEKSMEYGTMHDCTNPDC